MNGAGTFLTQWGGYNSAGQPGWMQYPGGNNGKIGEQVNFVYNAQGALDQVAGDATYVYDLQYDAAGRVTWRALSGSYPRLYTAWAYNAWDTQGGRLQYMKTGTDWADPTSLQHLQYNYDPVGNLDWIKDYKAGGTQTQTFTYDELDRLKTAQANGGSIVAQARTLSFGETRWTSGTEVTDFGFTGQREEAGLGLYFYNAR